MESSATVRVIIVDDSFVIRSGLRASLSAAEGISVVGEAGTGREGLELAARLLPDVVLMDIRMPDLDGISATRLLVERQPDARVLMLTWSENGENLIEAVRAGAKGYLVHGSFHGADLVAAIRTVAEGGALISPFLTPFLLEAFRASPRGDGHDHHGAAQLTARERDILLLIREQFTNRVIAERLGISEKTVKNYINSIYSKLHVSDREAAARYPLLPGSPA
ncbi:MAG TPA: response regulator transcription factor [Deinococcales bacterium]|nr:response regulator transcription factor [Deinococcales bacterium]